MPWRYEIEKSSGLFQMNLEGVISEGALDSFVKQVHADPRFPTAKKQLIWVRNTGKLVTIGLLIQLSGPNLAGEEKKVAVVVEDENEYIQTQFDQLTRKELSSYIHLFSVKEEAFQWLAKPVRTT